MNAIRKIMSLVLITTTFASNTTLSAADKGRYTEEESIAMAKSKAEKKFNEAHAVFSQADYNLTQAANQTPEKIRHLNTQLETMREALFAVYSATFSSPNDIVIKAMLTSINSSIDLITDQAFTTAIGGDTDALQKELNGIKTKIRRWKDTWSTFELFKADFAKAIEVSREQLPTGVEVEEVPFIKTKKGMALATVAALAAGVAATYAISCGVDLYTAAEAPNALTATIGSWSLWAWNNAASTAENTLNSITEAVCPAIDSSAMQKCVEAGVALKNQLLQACSGAEANTASCQELVKAFDKACGSFLPAQ